MEAVAMETQLSKNDKTEAGHQEMMTDRVAQLIALFDDRL